MGKEVTLKIGQISRPADLQLRESLDQEHIEELIDVLQAGGKLAPVKVVRDGNAYWLWDGHHTVTAHETAGVDDVPAIITKDGDRTEARWLACSANTDHGLKRSNKTKRRQVSAALKLNTTASDRAIAEHVKVSADLVADVRRKMTVDSDSHTRRTGKDGRTINTANIGRKTEVATASEPDPEGFDTEQLHDDDPSKCWPQLTPDAEEVAEMEPSQPASAPAKPKPQADDIQLMAAKTGTKKPGAEQVTTKARRDAYAGLGKVVRVLQDLGRLAFYRPTLQQIAEDIKPPKG